VVLSRGFRGHAGAYRVVGDAPEGEGARAYTLEVERDGEGLSGFLRQALDADCRVMSCEKMDLPLQEVFDRVVALEEEGAGSTAGGAA
jgi:hypothetical protein